MREIPSLAHSGLGEGQNSPSEQAVRRIVAPLPLVAVGLPIDAVVIGAGVFTAWATFDHSNLRVRFGPLDALLVTPGYHRVHHVARTAERNLGTIFTVWDALRGTLVRAAPAPDAAMGVPGETASYPPQWLAQVVTPVASVWERRDGRRGALTIRAPHEGTRAPSSRGGPAPSRR
jgi:sterol desaturase/sphingolipid hydroxylase (fatty acid hydroxylase superfamily)